MKHAILVVLMLLLPAALFAQQASYTHVFPQVVDGQSGSFYNVSIIWVTNESSATVNCTLSLYGVNANRASGTSLTLAPGRHSAFVTSGQGLLQTGYGRLNCTQLVNASLLFIQGDSDVRGMATVFSSIAPVTYANFPMLTGGGFRYAVALANDADVPADIALLVQLSSTSQIYAQHIQIPPRSHYSRFLDEILSAPLNDGGAGLVEIKAQVGSSFHITGLLYAGQTFTTIVPVTD